MTTCVIEVYLRQGLFGREPTRLHKLLLNFVFWVSSRWGGFLLGIFGGRPHTRLPHVEQIWAIFLKRHIPFLPPNLEEPYRLSAKKKGQW